MSFAATVRMAIRSDEAGARLAALIGLGLLTSGAAFAVGFFAWFRIAEIACHGGYECPF